MRLTCISMLEFVQGGGTTDRASEVVNFRGVSTEMNYSLSGNSPFIHRQIVFSSSVRLGGSVPVSDASGNQIRSPAVPEDAIPAMSIRHIFGVQGNLNWTDQFIAKVNKKNCVVYSDKTLVINPVGMGHSKMNRSYVKIQKNIRYEDNGDVGGGVTPCENSPLGNVYVLDIYCNKSPAAGETVGAVTVSSEMTRYWSE